MLILALTPEEEVVMVHQYRHGIERVCLELPGGLVDRLMIPRYCPHGGSCWRKPGISLMNYTAG